ncbi:MAG: hypothetical protein PUG80_09340 [Eubacteriales bacterium]|nr:hypothetical protein [Eubacteriales bacterium]MDY5347316.1 hypothetical protein [Eubacteriales bacterium]
MDTKGHPGYTSFFSEYGDVAPGLEVDHLKISREETAKRGILMIAHHSSIWDTRACEQHPEWCVIQKDGTPDPNIMEPNSAYVDQKLIPQLKELAGKYGFDGAWLDGDTWGVKESFRPEIVEQFLKETGFPCLEDDCSSPSRQAFRQFWCDRYMAYMHHLIREVKADYPNFEITISFAFSTLMPMKPIPEMDFLSGDVAALSDMRAVSRGFVHQGKPWDVMSWAAPDFAPGPDGGNVGIAQKNLMRLCREASQVISQGGGYEIVNNMTTKGEIRMSDLPHMAPLSQFVLARKPWNYQSKPLENPAILHVCENVVQTVGQDWKSPNLYASIWEAYATCDPFLDGGRPVDVLFGYHVLEDQTGSRKTLILPETKYMTEPLKQKLLDFVRKGGNLIVIGPAPCQTLAEDVGITITSRGKDLIYLEENGYLYGYFDDVACFDKTGCEELIPCYSRYMDTSAPRVTAAVMKPYGDGKVVFLGWNLITNYQKTRRFAERDSLRRIMDLVDPNPTAYLESGIQRAGLIPAEKDGKLLVNVVNTAEYYVDVYGSGYGELPPVYDLTVAIRAEKAPASVTFQPDNTPADYTYDGEYLHVHIPKLDIHTIIVVE